MTTSIMLRSVQRTLPTTVISSEPNSGTVVGVEIETSERNAVLEIFDGFVTGFWYKEAESEAY